MTIRNTVALCAASAMLFATTACTTTEKVNVMQPGDQAMTCTQLRAEFAKLDEIKADGQSDQGVNGANVAAVLFFWPAAVGNYMSARDALAVAERRHTHLMSIYNSKSCDNPANANLTVMVPSSLLGPIERSAAGMH
ncbi:hypothetical protein [Brevundimonas sp. NIBR11]|uniref:hypothetical protein n=1 Tax=Brevundimonas sp. NIBR11 TaxID=3015999 RepID=UPI0022EFFCF2|nr:hypothetical protein [Brevundimonas sp. NIBR11]WGM31470.1 hypothetical protein KKHFBJBL_01717 [Brevundimonas sp. NIBR11]